MCLQAARHSTCPESGASSSKAPQKASRSRWERPAAPCGRWRNSTATATVRSTGRWYILEDRRGVKARSRPSASNTGRDIPASSPSRSSISATSGASATPANSISQMGLPGCLSNSPDSWTRHRLRRHTASSSGPNPEWSAPPPSSTPAPRPSWRMSGMTCCLGASLPGMSATAASAGSTAALPASSEARPRE